MTDDPRIAVLRTRAAVREHVAAARAAGRRVGFVPTMGALHRGHLSLVEEARRHADAVIVSVFVNPTQFGPGEDLDAYPRDLDGDLAALAGLGADRPDAVFAPSAEHVYPRPAITQVRVPALSATLCGASRPGHFDGVGLVVTKLFGIVRPDVAVFGRKDFQQLAIVRRMTDDLDLGVEIVGAPIVREDDGLAMSSRNRYLEGEDRRAARTLSRALRAAVVTAREERAAGRTVDPGRLEQVVGVTLAADPRVRVDYAAVRDPDTLAPLDIRGEDAVPGRTAAAPAGAVGAGTRLLVAVAAHVGPARLIDNVVIGDADDEARLLAATSDD